MRLAHHAWGDEGKCVACGEPLSIVRFCEEAWAGRIDGVKKGLSSGIDVNGKVDFMHRGGQTALMLAADGGHAEIVRLLLSAHADIDAWDRFGNTPLMYAAGRKQDGAEIVEILLANNANLEIQHREGGTALMTAAKYGRDISVIRLLLAAGANISVRNKYGQTAFDDTSDEIAQILREPRTTPPPGRNAGPSKNMALEEALRTRPVARLPSTIVLHGACGCDLCGSNLSNREGVLNNRNTKLYCRRCWTDMKDRDPHGQELMFGESWEDGVSYTSGCWRS